MITNHQELNMRTLVKAGTTLLLLSLLAACGSSVKLDSVPVEDRAGAQVTGAAPGAGGAQPGSSVAAQSGVAAVDLGRTAPDAALPAGANLVYFDYDSFVIKTEYEGVVDAHARYLRANRDRRAAIEGHTDERGGREYNLALGQKRAEAVQRALTLLGVEASRLEAVSFGKEKPAVPGVDEASYAKNRRALIVVR